MRKHLRDLASFLDELVRAQHRDQLLLRAAALAYTTLFSLVPIYTVILVTAARVDPEQAELLVTAISAVLPFSPAQVQATLTQFAQRTASLGWIAVAVSFLVVMNLFYQIEEVINSLWEVPERRNWRWRLASFTALLVWGPLFLLVLFSSLYWLSSRPWYPLVAGVGRPLPAVFAILVLTTLYRWVPHTRVPWRAAWHGSLVATVTLLILHVGFQAYLSFATTLNVIYGSLTFVLLFLVSLFLFWLAVLLGAEASWVSEHRRLRAQAAAVASPAASRQLPGAEPTGAVQESPDGAQEGDGAAVDQAPGSRATAE